MLPARHGEKGEKEEEEKGSNTNFETLTWLLVEAITMEILGGQGLTDSHCNRLTTRTVRHKVTLPSVGVGSHSKVEPVALKVVG